MNALGSERGPQSSHQLCLFLVDSWVLLGTAAHPVLHLVPRRNPEIHWVCRCYIDSYETARTSADIATEVALLQSFRCVHKPHVRFEELVLEDCRSQNLPGFLA